MNPPPTDLKTAGFDLSLENLQRLQQSLYDPTLKIHPGLNRFYPYVEFYRSRLDSPWTYADLDRYQRECAENIHQRQGSGRLILSEVADVITLGRRTPASDILSPRAPCYSTDRGGLATWHGLGQWLLFPVESLETLTGNPRGIRRLIQSLLQIAHDVAQRYRSDLQIRSGAALGLWTSRGKLASVGVSVRQGVVLHGMSFNVFRSSGSFLGLRPCGLDAVADYLVSTEHGNLMAFDQEQFFRQIGDQIAERAITEFYPQSQVRRH